MYVLFVVNFKNSYCSWTTFLSPSPLNKTMFAALVVLTCLLLHARAANVAPDSLCPGDLNPDGSLKPFPPNILCMYECHRTDGSVYTNGICQSITTVGANCERVVTGIQACPAGSVAVFNRIEHYASCYWSSCHKYPDYAYAVPIAQRAVAWSFGWDVVWGGANPANLQPRMEPDTFAFMLWLVSMPSRVPTSPRRDIFGPSSVPRSESLVFHNQTHGTITIEEAEKIESQGVIMSDADCPCSKISAQSSCSCTMNGGYPTCAACIGSDGAQCCPTPNNCQFDRNQFHL
jgi:hypothetical protein